MKDRLNYSRVYIEDHVELWTRADEVLEQIPIDEIHHYLREQGKPYTENGGTVVIETLNLGELTHVIDVLKAHNIPYKEL